MYDSAKKQIFNFPTFPTPEFKYWVGSWYLNHYSPLHLFAFGLLAQFYMRVASQRIILNWRQFSEKLRFKNTSFSLTMPGCVILIFPHNHSKACYTLFFWINYCKSICPTQTSLYGFWNRLTNAVKKPTVCILPVYTQRI